MPTPPPAEQGFTIAEQLRALAAELDRHGRPEFVEAMFRDGRSEGLKALHATADHFLQRVDRVRNTLREIKHDAVAPYRAPVLKILKAIEKAADVKFAKAPGGPAKDDGEWLLAQRITLLPEHYRALSAEYGKTLNDLASEVGAVTANAAPAPQSHPRGRRGRQT
jgi:hypothetical protein